MNALLTPVAWYYRVAALALLAAVLIGFGWTQGAGHVEKEFDAYRLKVETAGAVQLAKNVAVTAKGVEITKESGENYAKSAAAISGLYGPGRVRNVNAGRRAAAPVPEAPAGIADRPADVGLGAGITVAAKDACTALKADAATVTLQFLFLREWIEDQAAAWER